MKYRILRLIFLCCIVVISSRYSLASVALDPEFGNDGRVAVQLGVYGDRANAVVVQPDGKIVVAGSSSNAVDYDFMLFRLLADGSLDPEFNFDGTVTSPVGSFDDEILALALQKDGKIIAGGYSSNGSDRDFALARYNSDGSLDRTFGREGMVVTPVGNGNDEISGIVLQADGATVVTGTTEGTAGRVIVLGRYLADGTLDSGFADGGFSFTGVGKEAQAEGVALFADQRIVVSGSYSDGENVGLMLVGFTPDGQLDKGFGDNGIAVPVGDLPFSEGYGMVIRDDGVILVAGSVGAEGSRDAALFRFTAAGAADLTFEDNGLLVTSVGAEDDVLYDVVVHGETIAASGFATVGNGREFLYISYEDSLVDVLTTGFGGVDDVATDLAVVPPAGVVVVGVSALNDGTSAVVSKFVPLTAPAPSLNLEAGNTFIFTGQAYDVTRTTATIPVQITFNSAITVGERGIVFSTVPNPVLVDNTVSDGGAAGTDTAAPVITAATPADFTTSDVVTLSVTTDEAATCRYNKDLDVAYASMSEINSFSGAGGTSHSATIGLLPAASYTYFVRCVDSVGNESAGGTAISFTVTDGTAGIITRTMQLVGDVFVSPAIAETSPTTVDPATTPTTDSSGTTNFFDPVKKDFIEEGVLKMGTGNGSFSATLDKLQPGTFFYARAYAVVDGKVVYGNQVGFRTGDSCFIATAAFGTIFHPCVRVLREFRDSYLLNNRLGRLLVSRYYRYSPPVADVIRDDAALRLITRILLLPVVAAAWLLNQFGVGGLLLMAAVAVVGFGWYITLRRRFIGNCP